MAPAFLHGHMVGPEPSSQTPKGPQEQEPCYRLCLRPDEALRDGASPVQDWSCPVAAQAYVCSGAHQQLLSAQVLLDFTNSRIEEVWSRALGRIEVLSRFLYNYSTQKVRSRHLLDRPCCSALPS